MRRASKNEGNIVGLDLAKNVFQAQNAGIDGSGVFPAQAVANSVAEVSE